MPAPELHSGSRPGWPSEHPLLSPAARAGARRTLCLPERPPLHRRLCQCHPRPALRPQPGQRMRPSAGLAWEAPHLRRPCGRLPGGSRRGTRSGRGPGAPGTCACSRRSGPHTGSCLRPRQRDRAEGRDSVGAGTPGLGLPPGRPPCRTLPPAALTGAALAVLLQLEVGPAPAAVLRGRELHTVVLAAAVAHGAGVDGWGRRAGSAGRRAGGAGRRGPGSRRGRPQGHSEPLPPPPSQRWGLPAGTASYPAPGHPAPAPTQGCRRRLSPGCSDPTGRRTGL